VVLPPSSACVSILQHRALSTSEGVTAKTLSLVASQLWSLMPAYCQAPTDMCAVRSAASWGGTAAPAPTKGAPLEARLRHQTLIKSLRDALHEMKVLAV